MQERLLRFTVSGCQLCDALADNLYNSNCSIPIEVVDIDVHTEVVDYYLIHRVPSLLHLPSKKLLTGVRTVEEIQKFIISCQTSSQSL